MAILEGQVEARRMRGQQIAQLANAVSYHQTHDSYSVQSQSGNGFYTVTPTETGFYCSCPDFVQRGVLKCKHIFAVEFSKKLRETVRVEKERREVVIEQFNSDYLPLLRIT